MKKTIAVWIIVVLLSSVFSGLVPSSIALPDDWIIDGDTVYTDDANVYLSATPHTITSSGWVYFNLTPKNFNGDIDVVWGFDLPTVKPTKAELYHPHWNNWTTNHEQTFYNVSSFSSSSGVCDFGNSYNPLHYDVTYQVPVGFDNTTNETIYEERISIVCFNSHIKEGTNYTAYWHTEHHNLVLWKDISSSFTKVNYNHGGMNTWYYVKNVPVVAGKSYRVRAWVDVPISLDATNCKYWWAVKPSSETISQAIANNHFYALDPWIDDPGWGYKKVINITGQSGAGTQYQVNLSIGDSSGGDFHLEGHCTDFPNDMVVTDDDGTTKLPFWIEDQAADPIQLWVNVSDDLNTSQDICVYYAKSGESSASDIANTFLLSDDWDDNDLSDWSAGVTTDGAVWDSKPSVSGGEVYATADIQSMQRVGSTVTLATYRQRMRVYIDSNNEFTDIGITNPTTTYSGYQFRVAGNPYSYIYETTSADGGVGETEITETSSNTPTGWSIFEVRHKSDGKFAIYFDDVLQGLTTDNADTDISVFDNVNMRIRYVGNKYDWFFMGKYVSPEPAFSSAGAEESAPLYIPPDPTTLQNTTGNFWVNYTWDAGSGNVTDSYNVWNGTAWDNGTTNTSLNESVGSSGWLNITVYAYNSTNAGALSTGSVSDQVQAPSLVSGYVIDGGGLPLGSVHITNNVTSAKDYTNASAFYELALPSNTYLITASVKLCYISNSTVVTVDGADISNVNITLNERGEPPIITDWYNNITNNNQSIVYINTSTCIYFNVTASQAIDTFYWYKTENLLSDEHYDNITTCWNDTNETGIFKVYGENSNGTTNTVVWYVGENMSFVSEQGQLLLEENEMLGETWIFLVLLLINFSLIFFVFKDTHDIFYGDSDVSISTIVISFLAVTLSFILARRALIPPIEMPELNYFLLAIALVMVVLLARFVIQVVINAFYAMKAKAY